MPDERDCEALLSLLAAERLPVSAGWVASMRQAAIGLIWRDLLSKSRRVLEPSLRLQGLLAAVGDSSLAPEPAASPASVVGAKGQSQLRKVDVLLICPLSKELNPASVVFEVDPFSEDHDNFEGHKIFYKSLNRGGREPLSVAISVINQPRNVPMAIGTFKLLLALKRSPELVILAGIGAGIRGKTTLGSVVISSKVIDIAGRRRQVTEGGTRDDEFPVDHQLLRQLRHLPPRLTNRENWDEQVRAGAKRLGAEGSYLLPADQEVAASRFTIEDAIIVAGEDLVADGSLPKHLIVRDTRIRSCDMEGSGFAQAAEESATRWAIFRGISDYGEPHKPDDWQALAAFGAALAARRFLEAEFRLAREVRTFEV